MNEQRLRRLRRLKNVPRWNGIPVIQRQTVDQHTFHVAYIALWIRSFQRFPPSKADILEYALIHDEPEAIFGDTPSPAKAIIGKALKEFEQKKGYAQPPDEYTKIIVKVADCLEALVFVQEEMYLGNRGLEYVETDILSKLEQAWEQFEWDGGHREPKPTGQGLLEMLWDILNPERHPVLDELKQPALTPTGDDSDIPF